MAGPVSLDGRTLAVVTNDEQGEVSGDTQFHFEQRGKRIRAHYSGGEIVDGFLVGMLDEKQWDIRYVQLNRENETATGHSVGEVTELDDGRVRVEDEGEWESQGGTGQSVLEEVKQSH